MVIERETGKIKAHTVFSNLLNYLNPGDLLVLNRTMVIPARLFGRKISGGQVEILLLKREKEGVWECLVGGKGLISGKQIHLVNGITAEVIDVLTGPKRLIKFSKPLSRYLSKIGQVPLPPYIQTQLENPDRYQTVYAEEPGSVAAPTAGLHFTTRLLNKIRDQGINVTSVTLHIGLDTFTPVKEENPFDHAIHTEWCHVSPETAEAVNQTKRNGGRVIAIGTTSVRALESVADSKRPGKIEVGGYSGFTSLYILPGYEFRVVDAMVTNFHLPRSSLILLVSAFIGRERLFAAYECAKKLRYRFYSFVDEMVIL